jgi:drug/metabolite transporter (DMT)-like permease
MIPFLRKKTRLQIHERRDLWALIAYALSGITGNIIFYFLGLQRTYAINATIIASGAPILTLFLAHTFLKEQIQFRKLMGFIFGAAGLGVIILQPLQAHEIDGTLSGNLFLVLAILCAVVQTIIGRNILQKYNPLTFTFWAFIIGAASFLPLAVHEYMTIPHLIPALDWRGFMGIAYGSIFSSAIAYTLFGWGLSKISATETSLIAHLDPIIGTILGYFVLSEPITRPFLIGAALIFVGIYIAEGRLNYHPIGKLRRSKEAIVEPPIILAPHPVRRHNPHTKSVIAALYNKEAEKEPDSQ